ncbi:metallophosphoesterase [Ornithobacterium rhinotracheale]|uniref:metallophosphoesterase n=1 Tax=Ornithobacterium rhinotracheale TaxID=28251 RepID=UPI004035FFBF
MFKYVILLFLVLIECYSFQAFRIYTKNNTFLYAYIVVNALIYAAIVYFLFSGIKNFATPAFKKLIILFTLFIVPKILIAIGMMIEDAFRLVGYLFQAKDGGTMPSRRKAVSLIVLGVASVAFLGVLDGILFGRYRFRVIRKKVKIKDLPEEFEGFTITQLSDIHSGSFDDVEKVNYGVQLANEQKSDILVFTGDMVNNHYSEFVPYQKIFSQLNAKDGMFAVLGNHDYGDYGNLTPAEKKESIAKIQEMQREMGFTVLNNEMKTIERNGKRLNIIGVENWGSSPYFPRKGDIRKASAEAKEGDINILLSHDPSHFDHEISGYDNIVDFEKFMHLTLSGHTHGMQFGIEIPGLIKWSPVQYRYHHWAGLYENKGRQHYVNRGFGYLAFPGRVGEWPEITVLELTRA